MLSKLKKLASSDGALFTLSNLIFSFSTYLIALAIPYKLDLKMMADFSATLNIVMILAFIFEFGLATSYLRFNQLYSTTRYINAYFQLFIFSILILFYSTFLGDYLIGSFGFENISLSHEYIYLSIFALLSWMFFKNVYLSNKNIKFIFVNAIILLLIRVGFLVYVFTQEQLLSLDEIFLYFFILPFSLISILNIKYIFLYLKKSFQMIGEKRNIKIFTKRFKQLLIFSALSYIINSLYIYTSRYAIVYLTEHNMTETLAELGYAFSFGGLIMVFMVSMRLYFISKFNISDIDAIIEYVKKIGHYKFHFIVVAFLFSLLISYIVSIIKPDYLTIRSIYFLFIIIFSYAIIAYYSMFTLLSKTFDFNKLELALNIVRLILVVVVAHFFMQSSPVLGFGLISIAIILIEYIFAKIVLRKVLRKEINNAKTD